MRRLCEFAVTGEEIARQGQSQICVSSPVPASSTFRGEYLDLSRNAFVCVFENESVPLVEEGALIPVGIGPIVTRGA